MIEAVDDDGDADYEDEPDDKAQKKATGNTNKKTKSKNNA